MNIIDDYLKKLHKEFGGYANPIQTRPKPKPGITGEDPKKQLPDGLRGPAGLEVDLEKQTTADYDITNFAKADYGDDTPKNKRKQSSEI
jgi:hypothetical protein